MIIVALAMSAVAELDPVFRYALKLLHSPQTDSAEKIRNALDDLIKQRHGSQKMLANTLHKKYLAEESSAPGSGIPPPAPPSVQRRHSHKSIDSKTSISSKSDSPVHIITVDGSSGQPLIISVPDDDLDDDDDVIMAEEDHMKVSSVTLIELYIHFFFLFLISIH